MEERLRELGARYPQLSKENLETLIDYCVRKRPPGDFLEGVLRNDLEQVLRNADSACTLDILREIFRYVYNVLPVKCWGSDAKVEDWLMSALQPKERNDND